MVVSSVANASSLTTAQSKQQEESQMSVRPASSSTVIPAVPLLPEDSNRVKQCLLPVLVEQLLTPCSIFPSKIEVYLENALLLS